MEGHAVEFRILGPVGVWADGVETPIGGQRPRALLAALLLAREHAVPASALVDSLWEEPPATATGRVHTIVSELRSSLSAAGLGSGLIRTRPDGYALDLAVDEGHTFDLDVFTDRTEAGRREAAAGRPDRAAGLFSAALEAWTGDALQGLKGPFAEEQAARWQQRRLDVLEAWTGARIEAARHRQDGVSDGVAGGWAGKSGPVDWTDLIQQLSVLVEQQPRREALVAHLMTALALAGRVPEALGVYRANRLWLRDELGLDAPRRLRELEAAILHGELEPSCVPANPADSSPGRPGGENASGSVAPASTAQPLTAVRDTRRALPPAQLPSAAGFVGRDAELTEIDRLLAAPQGTERGNTPLVLVTGPAGIGKTALALNWAHRHAAEFPDGQLFVDLRGHSPGKPLEAVDALGGFLRALGVAPGDIPPTLDEAAALYRSLLAYHRMLIVLDNVLSPQQVRPLIPGGAGCRVLATSRNRLSGLIAADGARATTLCKLSPEEAFDLISDFIGPRRAAEQAQDVRRLAECCAFVPLALRIAVAQLASSRSLPVAEFVRRLEHAGPLNVLTIDGDEQSSVAAALALSFKALTPQARNMLCHLGVVTLETYAEPAIAALSPVDTQSALAELIDAHLVVRSGHGRYALHDLVAAFASERAAGQLTDRQRSEARARILDWYVASAFNGGVTIYPRTASPESSCDGSKFAGHQEALGWFEAEHFNLVAIARDASAHAEHARLCDLAGHLTAYYDLSKRWDDWAVTHELAAASARALGDSALEAWLLNYVGVVHQQRNDFDAALDCGKRALRLARQSRDATLEAVVLNSLGVSLNCAGRLQEALEHIEQALSAHRDHDDADGETLTLNNSAEILAKLGRYEDALVCLKKSLEIAVGLRNLCNQRTVMCSLGVAHGLHGRIEEAVGAFRQAVRIGREIHDLFGVAESLACLGDALHNAGLVDQAHEQWREAAAAFEQVAPGCAEQLHKRTIGCCAGAGFSPQARC